MEKLGVILIMLALVIPLWVALRRDFIKGLAYAVFLCVLLTTYLRISMGGILPELTIHRLILISLFVGWWSSDAARERVREVPLRGCFVFWAVVNLGSLLLTHIEFVTSLKRYLDFILEVSLFYLIVASSIQTREEGVRIIRAAWAGLVVVAGLAIVERYTGFNPVDRLIPGYARDDQAMRDVLSTYPHRILLGTAMAMGWPIALGLIRAKAVRPSWGWLSMGMFLASCYFSMSRGPWLGAVGAAGLLVVLGTSQIRKPLVMIGALAVLTMIVRPGVTETLVGSAEATADQDSLKGGTFRYRLELWKIAVARVRQTTTTFLFGYGPGAGSEMEIEWELSYRGKERRIESWDNHFAYDLLQSGVLGFVATLALYLGAGLLLCGNWRSADAADKELQLAILASAAVFVFMMTNVLIFAKQLHYLFWVLVAVGCGLRNGWPGTMVKLDEQDGCGEEIDVLTVEAEA